jgi:hypothetical protein
MPHPRIVVSVALSVVLAVAVAFGILTSTRPLPTPTLTTPLANLLPREIIGWTVRDQPIAETEEMKKAVGELLNYDDAIFRTYIQGGTTISIYVAYWKPGKMSPRLVAGHSPDVCWIGNGWRCTARDFSYQLKIADQSVVRTAQSGTYELSSNVQHVLFWHLHQGQLISYEMAGTPPWWAALADLWKQGLNQRGEQFFIRISSNLPLNKIQETTVLKSALSALGPLGLYQD